MTTDAAPATRLQGDKLSLVMAAVWVPFMLLSVRAVLVSQAPAATKWVTVALVAVFAVVYCSFFYWLGPDHPSLKRKVAATAVLVGLALTMVPAIGWQAASLSPYLISYVTFAWPSRASKVVAPVLLAALVGSLVASGNLDDYLFVVIISAIIGVTGIVLSVFLERTKDVQVLERQQLLLGERDRLGRDVHDLLGHSLTVISLKAQLAEKLLESDPGRARAELSELRAIAAEAMSGVRQTVNDQRPTALATEVSVATSSLRSAGLEVSVVGDPADVEHAPTLAWVVREAATNILRHAAATHVVLELRSNGLSITDDGVGASGAEGNGIRGMRDRVERDGGTFRVSAAEPVGTVVEVAW